MNAFKYGTLAILSLLLPFNAAASETAGSTLPEHPLCSGQQEYDTKEVVDIPVTEGIVLTLNDNEVYNATEDRQADRVEYHRTFRHTLWQALYIPFAMNYEDWSRDFNIARINNFHQFDDDDDGTPDRTVLEVFILPRGSRTTPNTPYMIQPKSIGEKVLAANNVLVKKAETPAFDCTSWTSRYVFKGTYAGVSGQDMFKNKFFALSGGTLHYALLPLPLGGYRWYVSVQDRHGNPVAYTNKITLNIFDEDGNLTGVEEVEMNGGSQPMWPANVYNLQGKLVKANASGIDDLPRGIYIVNGKKVIK